MIQTRAACLHPGDPVGKIGDDVIAALHGHLMEVVELGLGMLIDGRDPHVEGGAFHLRRPFGLVAVEWSPTYSWMYFNSTSVMFWPWAAVMDLKALCSS